MIYVFTMIELIFVIVILGILTTFCDSLLDSC
ncbi:type II secretion system protein [uncultured Campylobacter sp.]